MGLKIGAACGAIVATLASVPAHARGATAAQPAGDPASWITPADYPREELRNDVEGTTSFELNIGADGLPKACKIVATSGSRVLDEATCTLLMQRARFLTARDEAGTPVDSTYANRVRWVVPQAIPAPTPYDFQMSFVVEADGSLSDCKLLVATGIPADSISNLSEPCMQKSYVPYRDAAKKPVARRVNMRLSVSVEPVE